jgi:hypothetical protein
MKNTTQVIYFYYVSKEKNVLDLIFTFGLIDDEIY